MTNIDWRAFWASFATMMIVLLLFFIVINPLIEKFNIKIVSTKPTSPVPAPTKPA